MIDVRAPVVPDPEVKRHRRWWVAFLGVVALVLAAGGLVGGRLADQGATPPPPGVFGHRIAAPSPRSAPGSAPAPSLPAPSATRLPPGLLQMRIAVPVRGTGKFEYARGRGPVAGRSGQLRRYHVAVEIGSAEDVTGFAAQVEATLGDPRSWIGGGRLRLQRVSPAERGDFTVFLATRDSAADMCARGGTNIRVNGVPYTSCRTTGRAIINLDRWRRSAPTYVLAGVPLAIYRQYVVNHEVGHELGHRHEGCPRSGRLAPVMVQQTLSLRGCTPYAWPRRGNVELYGPPV
jgi:hypothetical protein